jgi:GTP-binding protein
VLALSKADLVTPEEAAAAADAWRERLGDDVPVVVTSAATGQGVEELAALLARLVPPLPAVEAALPGEDDLAEHRVFRPAAERGWRVERAGDGFRVSGPGVERLVARYDLDNEEALAHLEGRLRGLGVIAALEEAGFQAGDDVEIAGVEFELDPSAPL